MDTIGSVLTLIRKVEFRMQLFGFLKDFPDEFNRRYQRVGVAIAHDQKVSLEQAKNLPDTTPLGPSATAAFAELKAWLVSQNLPPDG